MHLVFAPFCGVILMLPLCSEVISVILVVAGVLQHVLSVVTFVRRSRMLIAAACSQQDPLRSLSNRIIES